MLVIAWNIKINHKKKNHNFQVGQRVLGFGQRDDKMYFKIQKIYQKKYSGTGPRVIVTLWSTPLLQGTGPMLWGPVLGSTGQMSKIIQIAAEQ